VLPPDEVVLDVELPNALDTVPSLDERLCKLAQVTALSRYMARKIIVATVPPMSLG
jgi:hypothetical protein